MLQELFIATAAGGGNASALTQMGFDHLLSEMIANPGEFAVSWIVLLTLVFMSAAAWYWTIFNAIKNTRLKSYADRVVNAFWDAPNAQEAVRVMEEQPRSEPFSKIALDAAQAAAHHQRSEGAGAGMGETLSRSEFVDRALRQAVTRESSKLQSGMVLLATVGATGSASIDAVAGPVGEALIMTAIGLFVAIPAVFAYNFFSKINSATIARYDAFAHDLHDFFATGSRVR